MTSQLQNVPEFRSKSQALYFALNLYFGHIEETNICSKAKEVYDMILKELPSLPELTTDEQIEHEKRLIDHTLEQTLRFTKEIINPETPCEHPCQMCDEVPEDKRPLYESLETPTPGTDA